jgi:CubicO group peptidase (beta-lactamase class C family)
MGVSGRAARGFERVRDRFLETLPTGGGAFGATVDGRVVVDLWGRGAGGGQWEEKTAAVLFSGTKGVVATVLLVLADRGRLDLDAPVASVWPQFAQGGKGDITIGQLAAHAAGLPAVEQPLRREDLTHPERIAALLAAQEPMLPPGTPSYHAITWGWLCGEIVRRVEGRSAGEMVRELFGDLDIRIGVDQADPFAGRIARVAPSPDYRLGAYLAEDPDPRLHQVYGNPAIAADEWGDPALLELEIPAANGVATARAMAELYGRLVCGTLVRPATLALARTPAAEGDDPLTGRLLRFGPTGYELAGTASVLGPPADAFGHTGTGGGSHGGWPSLRTGFSYHTARLRPETVDARARSLLDTLHDAVTSR